MNRSEPVCTHLVTIVHRMRPKTRGCEECLKTGDSWVHLRLCLICGHVGCCDSSKNKHATKHFRATSTRSCGRSSPAKTGAGATSTSSASTLCPTDQRSCSARWMSWTQIDPSPTADATRLTLPERASPTAKTPGMLVSSK